MTVVDDIKGRLDILEVISHYVPLQRSGRSYKALCPYHQEKTPSFFVFPDRQTWRCFGACATGGDVFSFVMRAENLEFADTLKRLAQQTGVPLPGPQRRSERQVGQEINGAACSYLRQLLASPQGAAARAYLEERGLSSAAVEKFELGLSPGDGESLKNHLVRQGFSLQQLVQAGLVQTSPNGWHRDLFRGRLMFPVRNGQGELAGFGGRALDGSQPKYLNSPRSSLFDKGSILYALHLAKEAARQQGIVIVEGYMDAIAAHQWGFENVVASMGTALTRHHVSEIRRLTHDVTMALDPDTAGRQATLRSLESSWGVIQSQVAGQARRTTLFRRPETANLKIAILPEGMDPDEVIRRSPEEWARIVRQGVSYIEYLLQILPGQVDPATPEGKSHIVGVVLPQIQAVPEAFLQDHYFQRLADTLGITREALRAAIERPGVTRRGGWATPPTRQTTPSAFAGLEGDPLEEYCLAQLLHHPELEEAAGRLRPEFFRRPEHREVFGQWVRVFQGRRDGAAAAVLPDLVDEELAAPLEVLLQKRLPPLDPQRRLAAFQEAVGQLEGRYLRELKTEEEIRFSESPPDLVQEPYPEVLEVNRRIKENQTTRGAAAQGMVHRGK